nr:DegV family protein [Anaerolineae bacterium]
MSIVRIITDSTAQFEDPGFQEKHHVVVIPLTYKLDGMTYRDGIDLLDSEFLKRLQYVPTAPVLTAPSAEQFEEAYRELAKSTDQICVLVHSQHFTDTYANAVKARSRFLGRCEIMVIDSRTTSAGLGYLVEAAIAAASAQNSLDDVVRVVRGVIPRLYSVMYVNSLDYIRQAGLIGETQALLGAMLDIKPILTIEDGRLITMEKARTHSQAIDKMIEFVAEFTQVERLCVIQNTLRTTEQTRMLQDRLALEFPRLESPIMLYEPLTAAYIGPDGMGLYILEGSGGEENYDEPYE